jgi:hypothetical protein
MDAAGSSEMLANFSHITGHYPSILQTKVIGSSYAFVNL